MARVNCTLSVSAEVNIESILEYVFFLTYINDLLFGEQFGRCTIGAKEITGKNSLTEKKRVDDWFVAIKLVLNPDKAQRITFT